MDFQNDSNFENEMHEDVKNTNFVPYKIITQQQQGFSVFTTIGLVFIALLFSHLLPRFIGEVIIPFFRHSESILFQKIGYPIISELSLLFIPFFALKFYDSKNNIIYEMGNAIPNDYKITICFIMCFIMLSTSLISDDKCLYFPMKESDKLFDFILYLFIDCIFPSFCEEFVFRGWAFHFLSQKMNQLLAIIVTSFLFTLCHPFKSWFSYLLIFLLSACWNYANILVDSIIVSIVSHFYHNFSQTLMPLIIPSVCRMSLCFSFILWLTSSMLLFFLFNKFRSAHEAELDESSEILLDESSF